MDVLPDRLKKGDKLVTRFGYKCTVGTVHKRSTDAHGEPTVSLVHTMKGIGEFESSTEWSRDQLQELGVMVVE